MKYPLEKLGKFLGLFFKKKNQKKPWSEKCMGIFIFKKGIMIIKLLNNFFN